MTFAEPIYLYLALFLTPALALLMVYANRRRHAVLARLGNPALVRRLGASVNWRGRRWQTGLWFASIVLLLVLAGATPVGRRCAGGRTHRRSGHGGARRL